MAYDYRYTRKYELVAADQTAQALGATGKLGDVIETLIIVPETTGAGTCAIKDGSDTAINVLVAGTLADLTPIVINFGPEGVRSLQGAWQVTTGANVHIIAIGLFS